MAKNLSSFPHSFTLMKTHRILLVALCILAIVTACKKTTEEPAATRTAVLTAKAWKLASPGVWLSGNPVDDATVKTYLGNAGSLAQFATSDILFKSDGTYTATNKTTGATTSGEWAFKDNDTKIQLKSGVQSFDLTIDELTADSFKMSIGLKTLVPASFFDAPVQFRLIPA